MAISLSSGSDGNSTGASVSSSEPTKDSDMAGACSVCSDDQGTDDNPLVYCDGCDLAVHQACYGIVDVPSGRWFCRKCESQERSAKIRCELCPSKDGALKRTENNGWAHVVCALYIPEVRFGNNNTMEPIETRHIPPERYNRCCCLCEEKKDASKASYGACMHCNKQGCKQSFHVTCAQSAGLLCEEASQQISENIVYCGYCRHHFSKLKLDSKKKSGGVVKTIKSNSTFIDSSSESESDEDSKANNDKLDKNFTDSNENNAKTTTPILSLSPSILTNPGQEISISTSTAKTNVNLSEASPMSLDISTSDNSSKTPPTSSPKKKRASKSNPTGSSLNSSSDSGTLLIPIELRPPFLPQNTTPETNESDDKPSSDEKNSLDETLNSDDDSKSRGDTKTTSSAKSSAKRKSNSSPASKLEQVNQSSTSNNDLSYTATQNTNISLSASLATTMPTQVSPSAKSATSSLSTSSIPSFSNCPSPALASPNNTNKQSNARLSSPLAAPSNNTPRDKSKGQTGPGVENELQKNTVGLTNVNYTGSQLSLNGTNLQPFQPNLTLSQNLVIQPNIVPQVGSSNWPPSMIGNIAFTQPNIIGNPSLPPTISSLNTDVNNTLKDNGSINPVFDSNGISNVPRVPPLVISVNQTPSGDTKVESKQKSKTTPSSKKKTDSPSKQPGEAKQKISRAKKSKEDANKPPKPETKRGRAKKEQPSTIDPKSNEKNEPNESANNLDTGAKVKKSPGKRKSRSTSDDSSSTLPLPSPQKRPRKKKNELPQPVNEATNIVGNLSLPTTSQMTMLSRPQSFIPTSSSSTGPLMIKTPLINPRLSYIGQQDVSDLNSKFNSPLVSPFTSIDYGTPQLPKYNSTRLFTTESVNNDDPTRAFEDLMNNQWNHVSKFVLDQAQQFDVPSLIGLLYTLRSENEKLSLRVKELTSKREQLMTLNARLDLPGPMLLQHLNSTSPNFSVVVNGLVSNNLGKSIPSPIPIPSNLNKSPIMSTGSYNQLSANHMMPPSYIDRSSPLINQVHCGPSARSTSISTPSPPVGALMAHANNRAGSNAVSSQYMTNIYSTLNPMSQLGANTQPQNFYSRP